MPLTNCTARFFPVERFIFWSKGKAEVLQECRVHLKSHSFFLYSPSNEMQIQTVFSFSSPSPWPALRLFHDPSFNESPAPLDWKPDWITWSTLTVNRSRIQRPPGNSSIPCVVYTWPLCFHSIYWSLRPSLGIIINIKTTSDAKRKVSSWASEPNYIFRSRFSFEVYYLALAPNVPLYVRNPQPLA